MNKYFQPYHYSSRAHCTKCNIGHPGGGNMYDMVSAYLPLNPNHGFKHMCDLCACLKRRYLAINECDKRVVVYITGHGPVTMYFSKGVINAYTVCKNLRKLNLFHCAFHVEDDGPDNTTFRVRQKRGNHRYLAVVHVPAQ